MEKSFSIEDFRRVVVLAARLAKEMPQFAKAVTYAGMGHLLEK